MDIPTAKLMWKPETGFKLDLDAPGEEISLRLIDMPIPSDGTESLRVEPVALHNLDILFKAHVDWNGAPGQLHSATVQLVTENNEDLLRVGASVEDAETGQQTDISVDVPVEIAPEAPESGGFVPVAPKEDDLDWDDETTLEQMFSDMPMPIPSRGSDEDDDEDKEDAPDPNKLTGLDALLKALSTPEMDDATGEVPIGSLGAIPLPEPASAPADEPEPEPEAKPGIADLFAKIMEPMDAGNATFTLDAEAKSFLQLLVDHEHLELTEDGRLDSLAPGVGPILASSKSAEAKASDLSNWLLDQPAVEELYIDDESLASLLDQW